MTPIRANNVIFTKFSQIWRIFSFLQHSGNYRILLPHFFLKFSVKSTFYQELHCKPIWWKKKFEWQWISHFSTSSNLKRPFQTPFVVYNFALVMHCMVFREAWCHLVMQYLLSREAWCHLVICTWCQGWCLVPLVSYSNTRLDS